VKPIKKAAFIAVFFTIGLLQKRKGCFEGSTILLKECPIYLNSKKHPMKIIATIFLATITSVTFAQNFVEPFDNLNNWTGYSHGRYNGGTPCGTLGYLPYLSAGHAVLNSSLTAGETEWRRQSDAITRNYYFVSNKTYRVKARLRVDQSSHSCTSPLSTIYIHAGNNFDINNCGIPPITGAESIFSSDYTGTVPYQDIDVTFTPLANHSLFSIYVISYRCNVTGGSFVIDANFFIDFLEICEVPSKPAITSSTGHFAVCTGEPITLSAPFAFAYKWSNGASTQSIQVSSGGTYTVQVLTKGLSCISPASNPVTVNYYPETRPTIQGVSTICPPVTRVYLSTQNNYLSYKWSNGATSYSTFVPVGTYTVSVLKQVSFSEQCWIKSLAKTVSNGTNCAPPRGRMLVSNESNEEELDVQEFSVFPNPSRYSFTVRLSYPAETETSLIVYDLNGKSVKRDVFLKGEQEKVVDSRNITSGLYRVLLRDGDTAKSLKLFICHE
jgi:hypothetical protein